MIFAAGLGTRFKPWTDKHPKALALVNGKSLLQRNIEYLQRYGITDVVVNVHHFADQVIEAVQSNKGWGSNIMISDEREEVLETGGGLLKARHLLENDLPFITLNVDILTNLDINKLLDFHNEHKPLVSFGVTDRKTSRYFLFNDNDELCGWRNVTTGEERISKPANSYNQKAFSGIHVLSNRIFEVMQQQGKFSMVDVYLSLATAETIKCFDHSESKFIDVGKPESIIKAEELFS